MPQGPVSKITSEYLMTTHFPIQPGYSVDDTFMIWCVQAGGWAEGPDIKGEFIGPTGDWGRFMPDGTLKLDVRSTIRTDDDAIIYMTFDGRFVSDETIDTRLDNGETIGPDELHSIITPSFETGSEKYTWLNQVVAAGKLVSLKGDPENHVRFDIFKLT